MKDVYQFTTEGIFIGVTQAQESPLEPGVYLMPANTTDKTPPKCKEGYTLVWLPETQKWSKVLSSRIFPKEDGGEFVASDEQVERDWRNSQLAFADIAVNTAEDHEDEVAAKQWREYRKALRAWPADSGFPNKKSRPVAPE